MQSVKAIHLTGLIGSSPLGVLAAFGLMRVCSEIQKLNDVWLSWTRDDEESGNPLDDWVAVLTVKKQITPETLIDLLVTRQQKRPTADFDWNTDIRSEPKEFERRLIEHAMNARFEDDERTLADFFVAFGSETLTDKSKKKLVKPTAFHMTSGQQEFLKNLKELAESMRKNPVGAFREALFGPWQYMDPFHSLGWDPTTERLYALRHRAPTKEAPCCVRAAVWLAYESLPLFPTARVGTRLRTTGFSRADGEVRFTWPLWTRPIGLSTLRSLLGTEELYKGRAGWEALEHRGVTAAYQTIRSEFGQGYAIFRPAKLVFSAE
ncbi:MAG: type I-G CRISPR-associated protein, Cas3-extension family [Gammaproteobacteria bacterium]